MDSCSCESRGASGGLPEPLYETKYEIISYSLGFLEKFK